MADINDIVDRQRRELAARDKALLDQISADYKRVAQRIGEDWRDISRRIREAQEKGEDFSPSWLFRQNRLGDLLAQAQAEFARFSATATARTSAEQLVQLDMSTFHFFEAVNAELGGAALGSGITFNRLPTRAVEGIVGRSSDGSPLKELFDKLGPDFGAKARDELIQAVAIGQSPRTTASRISDLLAGNEARAQLIARTETIQAYREGSHLTSVENADVLDGWIWITALDGRACAACIALNGSFHSIEERMACHPACRCTKRFQTQTWAELGIKGIGETKPPPVETGPAWFKNVPRGTQELILGKRGAAAYADGTVTLKDFVGLRKDERWGPSYFQRSFKDAIKGPQRGVKIDYPLGMFGGKKIPKPKPAPAVTPAQTPAITPAVEKGPKPLTALQARKELERLTAEMDAADKVTSETRRVARDAAKQAIRERNLRGEITTIERNKLWDEIDNEQSKWVQARLAERAETLRNVLRVSDPIEVEADFSKLKWNIHTSPERIDEVTATIKKGVEDFRNFVSDKMRPLGKRKAGFDSDILVFPEDIKALKAAGRTIPTVSRNTVRILGDDSGRAFQSFDSINISFGNKEHIVVHELGHWLEEFRPDVREAIRKFYERRTKGEAFQKLKDLHPNLNFWPNEITKRDKFIEDYMGKWYAANNNDPREAQRASEILSYGLELFHKEPMRLARDDPDYFDFIYKLVRGK